MIEYRFKLDQTRGTSTKITCPHCNSKKSFKRYMDTVTGEYISDECGRCDHEQSCGWHVAPAEYFSDHPDVKEKFFPHEDKEYWRKNTPSIKPKNTSKLEEPKPIIVFNSQMVAARHYWDEEFLPWLLRQVKDKAKVDRVFEDYRLGSTEPGHKYNKRHIILWRINKEGQVCEGKIMGYKPDGHRQNWMNCVSYLLRESGQIPENAVIKDCLFGEHLLPKYPESVVCLVEGEKNALVCSCFYPDIVWIASGSCSALNEENIKAVEGREVIVFPDSGELKKWTEVIKSSNLEMTLFHFCDALESYPPNTDLADLPLQKMTEIIDRELAKLRCKSPLVEPAAVAPPMLEYDRNPLAERRFQDMAKDNPALLALQEEFDLQAIKSFKLIPRSGAHTGSPITNT